MNIFIFFSIVFPSFEKGKKVLLICIRVKNVHLKDFFRHKHHFSFSKGSTLKKIQQIEELLNITRDNIKE